MSAVYDGKKRGNWKRGIWVLSLTLSGFQSLIFSRQRKRQKRANCYLTLHIFILDKVKHVRKKIPDNLAKENSSLNRKEVEGIVEEIDGSINLKCPICNNIQTCNPSEYLILLLYNTSESL